MRKRDNSINRENNNVNDNDTRVYKVEQWQWTPVLRFLVETERETRLRLSREHELGVTPPMLCPRCGKSSENKTTILLLPCTTRRSSPRRFLYCLFSKDIVDQCVRDAFNDSDHRGDLLWGGMR